MTTPTSRLLTTVDNPYNPFTHWVEWYAFDTSMGYHTCGLLDRVTEPTEGLGSEYEVQAIRKAVVCIIKENVSGVHTTISAPT